MAVDREIKQRALQAAKQEWGGRIKGNKLVPISAHLGGLVSDPGAMCFADGNWFAFNIEPRQDALASASLSERGIVPFMPKIPVMQRHGRGRMREAQRPVFPGYGFVKCRANPSDWHKITSARGVHRLLADVRAMPLRISEGEIEVVRLYVSEQVQKFEDAQRARPSGMVWHFSEGDVIRIKTGPFAQLHAELTASVDEHDRIRALVSLFGRETPITLSAFEIEAL